MWKWKKMKYTMTTLGGIHLSSNAQFPMFHCLLFHNTTFPLFFLFWLLSFLWFLSPSLHYALLLSLYSVPHNPSFLFPSILLFCSSSFFYPRCLHIDPPKNLTVAILESPPLYHACGLSFISWLWRISEEIGKVDQNQRMVRGISGCGCASRFSMHDSSLSQ